MLDNEKNRYNRSVYIGLLNESPNMWSGKPLIWKGKNSLKLHLTAHLAFGTQLRKHSLSSGKKTGKKRVSAKDYTLYPFIARSNKDTDEVEQLKVHILYLFYHILIGLRSCCTF